MRKVKENVVLRMRFNISRDESPLLAAALISAKQGKTRHVRLLTLASMGLMVERQMTDGYKLGPVMGDSKAIGQGDASSAGGRLLSDDDVEDLEDSFGGQTA
jgi:hypothetical protein